MTSKKEELKRNYEALEIFNAILRFSLTERSLDDFLKKSLDLMISVPWIAFESRGSVFVVDKKDDMLVMKAQNNLSGKHRKRCARLHFGECMCGRAAETGKTQFIGSSDKKHNIVYKNETQHGHYCVPIMSSNEEVLGVLNLYVEKTHLYSKSEEAFIKAITDIMAGVIERESLKEALVNSEKIAAISTMAATVAHELRNPLGVINIAAYNLKKKFRDQGETFTKTVDIVMKKVEEADKIINDLLNYFKARKFEKKGLNINELLDETLSVIGNEYDNRKVVTKFGNIPDITADPVQIGQVFHNVIKNAHEAVKKNGRIDISTAHEKDKKMVRINIADNGCGILEKNIKKISEPFFTTKPDGTGLGLAISFRIIEEFHGGSIKVKSEGSKGTEFVIKIPTGV